MDVAIHGNHHGHAVPLGKHLGELLPDLVLVDDPSGGTLLDLEGVLQVLGWSELVVLFIHELEGEIPHDPEECGV